MGRGNRGVADRNLHTLLHVGTLAGTTDAQLLERFTSRREDAEAAFAVLVERHGPMVLRTCRVLLRDGHEAEDAFQATFLVLVRKGGGLKIRDSLGPWLHQVAVRTASNALKLANRRRRHERAAAARATKAGAVRIPSPDFDADDLGGVLREEVARLSEPYRLVAASCLLEGASPEQAAASLHLPIGTVHSRLARGRMRLRERLRRRGLTPPAGPAPGTLSEGSRAAPPASLSASTVAAAMRAAEGAAAPIASLVEGAMRMGLSIRSKTAAALLLATGAVAIGGLHAGPRRGDDRPTRPPRHEGRADPQVPRDPPSPAPEVDRGTTPQALVDGLLARSTAVASGALEYHLKYEIAGRVIRDSDYRFRFSGGDWSDLDLRSKHARVNRDGRLLTYVDVPAGGGRLTVGFAESSSLRPPEPPTRAGTLWYSDTRRFVSERADQARIAGTREFEGVETIVLEWDVAPQEAYAAFQVIGEMLLQGGKLRIHVAPRLGYALPRVEYVDRFDTVQNRFDCDEFREVAPGIHMPARCRIGVDDVRSEYRLRKIDRINERFSDEDFLLPIPAGASISDERPKSKDVVDAEGKSTYSLTDYPFRNFHANTPYPEGLPPALLKELDRDVVAPTGP